MGEETLDSMNFDLNAAPGSEAVLLGSIPTEERNSDVSVDYPVERIREAVRQRIREQLRRWQRERHSVSVELEQLMGNSGNLYIPQSGEGSVSVERGINDMLKMGENTDAVEKDELSLNGLHVETGSGNDGSFFDCNICFDLATDPVVTCCGHLFCWTCIYLWLHEHSKAKECPICKGEVTTRTVIPIYGRGSNTRRPEGDTSSKIPVRPHAMRNERSRQSLLRNALNPIEIMQHLRSRINLSRDLFSSQVSTTDVEIVDMPPDFLDLIRASGVLNFDQNPSTPPLEVLNSTGSRMIGIAPAPATAQVLQFHSMLLHRSQLYHNTALPGGLGTVDGVAESVLQNVERRRNRGRVQSLAERDTFRDVAAILNSESQVDVATRFDSPVSFSASSSRRRPNAFRGSDGNFRAAKRRRLN